MNFDIAFELVIGHEGGYTPARPGDPGGETKFGISKRSYPMEDIPNLTLERAKLLYKRDFWGPAGCDVVPDFLRFHIFDFAVNSGPKTAIKALQRSIGEFPDGIIGPLTLAAVNSCDLRKVALEFNLDRLQFMTELANWDDNSRGWTRRQIKNLRLCLKD